MVEIKEQLGWASIRLNRKKEAGSKGMEEEDCRRGVEGMERWKACGGAQDEDAAGCNEQRAK
jgi:hypothetical protein